MGKVHIITTRKLIITILVSISFINTTKQLPLTFQDFAFKQSVVSYIDTYIKSRLFPSNLGTEIEPTNETKYKQLPSDTPKQLFKLSSIDFISSSQICKKCGDDEFFVVFIIHSAVNNTDERDAIRHTWGKEMDCMKFLYILGVSDKDDDNRKVEEEKKINNDIIQANFMDNYRNLTYKHIAGLKWVNKYCKIAKYMIKADDDVMVNINLLNDKLKNDYWGREKLIVCELVKNTKVKRPKEQSKWSVSKKEYYDDKYPDYCTGAFIIYSPDVITQLLEESTKLPLFWIDDVHITGTLAKRLGIQHTNIVDLFVSSADALTEDPGKYLFGPEEIDATDIFNIWEASYGKIQNISDGLLSQE